MTIIKNQFNFNSTYTTQICTENQLDLIISALIKNEVTAIPTETVYGLAGNAYEEIALAKIFEAKERPTFDPLIVHIPSTWNNLEILIKNGILHPDFEQYVDADLVNFFLKNYFPGPLTLLLPKGNKIPDLCTSGLPTVAIRMPTHPLAQKLLSSLPFPLAAPSANRFGRISPTQAEHVMEELQGRIPYILNGGSCTIGLESTIIGPILENNHFNEIKFSHDWRIYRFGGLELENIKNTLSKKGISLTSIKQSSSKNTKMHTPGSLDSHYSPRTPLILLENGMDCEMFFEKIQNDKKLQKVFLNLLIHQKKNQLLNDEIHLGFLCSFKTFNLSKDPHSLLNTNECSNLEDKINSLILANGEEKGKGSSIELKFQDSQTLSISPKENSLNLCAQNFFLKLRLLDQNPNVDLILAENNFPDHGLGLALSDRLFRAAHFRL